MNNILNGTMQLAQQHGKIRDGHIKIIKTVVNLCSSTIMNHEQKNTAYLICQYVATMDRKKIIWHTHLLKSSKVSRREKKRDYIEMMNLT